MNERKTVNHRLTDSIMLLEPGSDEDSTVYSVSTTLTTIQNLDWVPGSALSCIRRRAGRAGKSQTCSKNVYSNSQYGCSKGETTAG
jgi:hypothetical protein